MIVKSAEDLRALSAFRRARVRSGPYLYCFRREVRIVQWLLFPVAVLASTLMVMQSGCNGMLEKIIDRPVMVGVISLGVGLTTLLIAGIATGELGFRIQQVTQGPWWAWLGGLCVAVSLLS